MESILNTIKKLLGICEDYEVFDIDIIVYINMAFNNLNMLGVGPKEGFTISDASTTWNEFLGDERRLEMVKTYVYLKVRQVFDPGSGSFNTSVESMIDELEWKLTVQIDALNKNN